MNDLAQEIVIRDFSNAQPAEAVSDRPVKGRWRLIDWCSSTDSGTLLYAYLDPTPGIVLELNAGGVYAISLGLFGPAPGIRTSLNAKLSNDDRYSNFKLHKPCDWIPLQRGSYRFEEHFWKIADLSGQKLHVSPTPDGTGLGFIRLIPLSKEQIARFHSPERVPFMWTLDGHGHFVERHDTPGAAVTNDLEAMAGTDFQVISWGILGADVTNYNTRAGRRFDTRNEPTFRHLDTAISENIDRLNKSGQNPCALAIRTARRLGLKVFIAQRPQLFALEPPCDFCPSEFYKTHRHLACKTADGRPLMQMSYAYPEVRRHLLDILAEVAAFKPDGLHLLFNRGVPCTLYEEPVVEGFREAFGKDIRLLDRLDPQAVEFRYRYVTAYLREMRQMAGADMILAANCFATRALNDQFGLDVEGWAKEGLVQYLFPYNWEWQPGANPQDAYDMVFFNQIARTTGCQIWPHAYNRNAHPNEMLPHQHRERALKLIRAGAKGLAAWDAYPQHGALNLGHVNELEIWEQLSTPLPQTDIILLGGVAVDPVGSPHYG
ncbi:MAG: hypothetical protein WCV67_21290, partial [Victivallaceae bacterium]